MLKTVNCADDGQVKKAQKETVVKESQRRTNTGTPHSSSPPVVLLFILRIHSKITTVHCLSLRMFMFFHDKLSTISEMYFLYIQYMSDLEAPVDKLLSHCITLSTSDQTEPGVSFEQCFNGNAILDISIDCCVIRMQQRKWLQNKLPKKHVRVSLKTAIAFDEMVCASIERNHINKMYTRPMCYKMRRKDVLP